MNELTELELVDLGEVSQESDSTVSTGKFEISTGKFEILAEDE